jgi:DNA-binding CsgD family transcriptional regulator
MRDVFWCLFATLGARCVNGDAVSREFGNVLFFRGIDNLVGSAKELQAGEEIKVGQVCFAPPHVAYVSRRDSLDSLVNALLAVAAGERRVSPEVERILLDHIAVKGDTPNSDPHFRLSGREWQVFQLLGDGVSTRGISEQLGVSIKTVESHYARIRTKLGVRSGSELRRYAAQKVDPRFSEAGGVPA